MPRAGQTLNGQSLATVPATRGRSSLLAGTGFMHHASADAAFKRVETAGFPLCGKHLIDLYNRASFESLTEGSVKSFASQEKG